MLYIKKIAGSVNGVYIGTTRKDPSSERGHPSNSLISNFCKNYGVVPQFSTLMTIPTYKINPIYGETYLINCVEECAPQIILLNSSKPHGGGFGYDKESKNIVDKLLKLI
jgi:hypothetical protein